MTTKLESDALCPDGDNFLPIGTLLRRKQTLSGLRGHGRSKPGLSRSNRDVSSACKRLTESGISNGII